MVGGAIGSLIFTFQSGSIQIKRRKPYISWQTHLYIPIWFYSNPGWKSIILISSYFTFQSGSIQIIFTASFKSPITNFTFQSGSIQIHQTSVRLYTSWSFTFQSGSIQIWTYSSREGYTIELYIPIWFYSNYSLACAVIYAANFTFQSGSIQMINPWTVIFKYIGFTFQSGSIQI